MELGHKLLEPLLIWLFFASFAGATKYPLVGCTSRTSGWTFKQFRTPLTKVGVDGCLDLCRSDGFVFGGLDCPGHQEGFARCRCYSGKPQRGDYWVTPQNIRFTNNPGSRCNKTSVKCNGPTMVDGYFTGGDGVISVYGLASKEEWVMSGDGYQPLAILPKQSTNSGMPASNQCADPQGLEFSSLVPSSSSSQSIVIASGTTYILKRSATIGSLLIEKDAVLAFSDVVNLSLSVSSITVEGSLQVGTRACPLRAGGVHIILRGSKPSDPTVSTKEIVARSGATLDMHGMQFLPTWTRLLTRAEAGATTLKLQQSVNWQVGQEILVVTTTFVDERGDHQNEVRKLVAVHGDSITLDRPLDFVHYGGPEYFGEIALLSRSITIQGDEQSEDEEFGGHTSCLEGSLCRLSFIRGHRMGQKNMLGRYPFHFHLMGNVAQQSYMEGLAVEHSYFRAFVIHGTSNATISSCIGFDISGSAFYLEDGFEEYNLIQFNLIAYVHVIKPHSEQWKDYDPPDGSFSNIAWIKPEADRVVPGDLTPAAFYCTNPRNHWIGNVASGGFTGFLFPVLTSVLGQSYERAPKDFEPMRNELLEFEGNEAHSSGQWFMNGACIYVGGEVRNPTPENTSHQEYYYWKFGSTYYERGRMLFNNTLMFRCRAGFKSWGFQTGKRPQITMRRTEFHDMMLGVAFFGHNSLQESIFTARTNNTNAFQTYTPAIGFQLYDTLFQSIFSDTVFRGFSGPADIAFYQGVISDCCTPTGMLGAIRTTFVNTPFENRFQFNPNWPLDSEKPDIHGWQWANAVDMDGSITGITGGALLGAGDSPSYELHGFVETHEWFRLDDGDTCQLLFTESNSRGYWACPRSGISGASQERQIVSLHLVNTDRELQCQSGAYPIFPWGASCSMYTQSAPETVLRGTLYHFGRDDRKVKIGWTGDKAGKQVVGICCDIGWYLEVDGGSTPSFQIHLEQMVPTGGLIFATRYPVGAGITVDKCWNGRGDAECNDVLETTDKSDFLSDETGAKFFLEHEEGVGITLFLKLVNERNEFFEDGYGAKVLATDFYYQSRYVVRSTNAGPISRLIPPSSWIPEVTTPLPPTTLLVSTTLSPPPSSTSSSTTLSPSLSSTSSSTSARPDVSTSTAARPEPISTSTTTAATVRQEVSSSSTALPVPTSTSTSTAVLRPEATSAITTTGHASSSALCPSSFLLHLLAAAVASST